MSIAAMADGAIQRKLAKEAGASSLVTARPATGEGVARTITPLKAATDVARYIPTEAIALYIAILAGAFGLPELATGQKSSDLDYTSRWYFYFIMLGVTMALVWLVYAAKRRETPAKDPGKRFNIPMFEMAMAAAAMAGWAAALPDSPFADFEWYGGWFPPFVLAATTALLPLVAAASGRTPPTYEEEKRD